MSLKVNMRVTCDAPGCDAVAERWCQLLSLDAFREALPAWQVPSPGTRIDLACVYCPQHAAVEAPPAVPPPPRRLFAGILHKE